MADIDRAAMTRIGVTLIIAALGGLLAYAVGLPVAWLLGPVVAISLMSVAGFDTRLPEIFRQVAFFVLGEDGALPHLINLCTWSEEPAVVRNTAGALATLALDETG